MNCTSSLSTALTLHDNPKIGDRGLSYDCSNKILSIDGYLLFDIVMITSELFRPRKVV